MWSNTNSTDTYLSRINNRFNITDKEITDNILYAIVTNDLNKLKSLLNKTNINIIIDKKNNYTSLHYAVTLPNNDITKLIIELGGDPKMKQAEGLDAFELALKSGRQFIFTFYQKIQIDKNNDLVKVNTNLEKDNDNLKVKIDHLKKNNSVLIESIDSYIIKTNKLNDIIENKDKDLNTMKEKITSLNFKIDNLNNTIQIRDIDLNTMNKEKNIEINKLKRKLEETETNLEKTKKDLKESEIAFNTLLKKNKK